MITMCRFGLHDWDDWEMCEDERYQERYCFGCGMIQRRLIKVFGEPMTNTPHMDANSAVEGRD